MNIFYKIVILFGLAIADEDHHHITYPRDFPYFVLVTLNPKHYQPEPVDNFFVTGGTIINIQWVLTVGHKLEQGYLDKELIVTGGRIHTVKVSLEDVSHNRVIEKILKPGSNKSRIGGSNNLCLLKTERFMKATEAFIGWKAKHAPYADPSRQTVSAMWVHIGLDKPLDQQYYEKWIARWVLFTEDKDHPENCVLFIKPFHICLIFNKIDRKKRQLLRDNTTRDYLIGGPIITDNEFQGVFVGREMHRVHNWWFGGVRVTDVPRNEVFKEVNDNYNWIQITLNGAFPPVTPYVPIYPKSRPPIQFEPITYHPSTMNPAGATGPSSGMGTGMIPEDLIRTPFPVGFFLKPTKICQLNRNDNLICQKNLIFLAIFILRFHFY